MNTPPLAPIEKPEDLLQEDLARLAMDMITNLVHHVLCSPSGPSVRPGQGPGDASHRPEKQPPDPDGTSFRVLGFELGRRSPGPAGSAPGIAPEPREQRRRQLAANDGVRFQSVEFGRT